MKSSVGFFSSSVLLSADLLVNILPSPGIYGCCFSEEKKGIKKKKRWSGRFEGFGLINRL